MPRFSLKQLIIATATIAVGIVALIRLSRRPFDEARFTPAAWAKADDKERARMSGDLVRNQLPRGLSQTQVEALIGTTNFIMRPGDGYRAYGAETHVYGIDNLGSPTMDDAFVYVHYDENGDVISAEITGY